MEALEVLRREFASEDGTFMLALYAERRWDCQAFTRLEQAMRSVAMEYADRDQLDRWLAEGYFHLSTWVRDHTSHPDFPRPMPDSYYDACVDRLWELADWYFRGEHIYQEPHVWEAL
ncbi:hypothetical protein ACIBF5_04005 [Micromonospora sp. NPDC050417]|uniref:hypothetical protein n=1 Tax=Micromonospora sp. NPDC050417 TaxID=3364280 RepID=UPI0037A21B5D